MTLAYSYVRFSSKKQEQGDSVRRQVQAARAYAVQHNLTLDERSYDDLNTSAFKGKNLEDGALGAFLKAVDEKIIPQGSYLLVESLDRVSRENVMDALDTFNSIIRRGIVLVTLLDGQKFTRENINENWTKLIAALAVMARANEESATKSTRVSQAWAAKRDKGFKVTSVGPCWLKLEGPKPGKNDVVDKRVWKSIPDAVKTIQYMFELAAKDMGTPRIADRLNAERIPTLGTAPMWEPALVMSYLKNKSVIGIYTPKKAKDAEPIVDYYPAIVKSEVFDKVQQAVAGRRKTGGPKGANISNLFTGLFRCECGDKVRYVSSNKPHIYLQCKTAYSKMGCDAPTQPYLVIEKNLLRNLEEEMPAAVELVADPTVLLRAQRDEKKRYLQKMVEAINLVEGGSVSLPTLAANMARLEAEVAGLEKQLKQAVVPQPIDPGHKDFVSLLSQHKKAQAKGGEELTEVRERMQGQIKRLVTKIVLRKKTHHDSAENSKYDWRQYVVYGPYADRFIAAWKADPEFGIAEGSTSHDGGLVFDYMLDGWGIRGTRKRSK
jgi:DNA invertase Pin-like site-specific DNA recombinase